MNGMKMTDPFEFRPNENIRAYP